MVSFFKELMLLCPGSVPTRRVGGRCEETDMQAENRKAP